MAATERIDSIRKQLLEKKFIAVSELAVMFSVTEETIRRDLKTLENEGTLTRTHGGAILKEKVSSSFPRSELKNIMMPEKERMAKSAFQFIQNGFCIFLDASTTVQTLSHLLTNMQLTVATDSLDVAMICSYMPNIKLILIGGICDHRTRSFSGLKGEELLGGLYFDAAFISCRTIDMETGLTDSNIGEATTKNIAVRHSKKAIALVDHTKFNRTSFAKICELSDIDILITDEQPEDGWNAVLQENSVDLMIAK